MTSVGPGPLLMRGGGVSLVLDFPASSQPEIVCWGADLGEILAPDLGAAVTASRAAVPPSGSDEAPHRGLLPLPLAGYRLTPGVSGFRHGAAIPVDLRLAGCASSEPASGGGARTLITSRDERAGLEIRSELNLDAHGVLTVRHEVTNIGEDPFELTALLVTLPLPARAVEIADFSGKWSGERAAQRLPLRFGSWVRDGHRGRPSSSSPYLTSVGTEAFSHRSGEVWAMHVGWSGNQTVRVEADPDGSRAIVGGELLEPGEIVLTPGSRYTTPTVYATYSDCGTDGISRRWHASIRARAAHPVTPRPVVLNTWEAVYFRHDLGVLTRLAETAAGIGVERFVLDDGWFGSRRDDSSGLGDWVESDQAWPAGLAPLVDRVHALGMQFGLWVEPEMVNPDSDLHRAHPDWVLAAPGRLPPLARNQLVLDVARTEVQGYLFDRMDALVKRYGIASLKWDHNRDVIGAVHGGRAGVHAQTLAVYELLDRLIAANPGLEIESCASGGSRVDLGILARTHRVWASDCNDALERQAIQEGTAALIPLELIGAHVGPPRSHTTSRTQDLGFRVATALFGHFGVEWDIAAASPDERASLAAAIAEYRRLRPLLHAGDLVNADYPDPSARVRGVVAQDRAWAVFCFAQLAMSRFEVPPAAALPGLDRARRYRVRPLEPAGAPRTRQRAEPPWLTQARDGRFDIGGGALSAMGLAMPALEPEQAMLVELTALP